MTIKTSFTIHILGGGHNRGLLNELPLTTVTGRMFHSAMGQYQVLKYLVPSTIKVCSQGPPEQENTTRKIPGKSRIEKIDCFCVSSLEKHCSSKGTTVIPAKVSVLGIEGPVHSSISTPSHRSLSHIF